MLKEEGGVAETKTRKTASKPRETRIDVRLTVAEKERVKRYAKRAGIRLSQFVRARVLRGPELDEDLSDISRRSKSVQDRDRLVNELARVGNNLNQLARIANTSGEIRKAEQLESALQEVNDLILAIARLDKKRRRK